MQAKRLDYATPQNRSLSPVEKAVRAAAVPIVAILIVLFWVAFLWLVHWVSSARLDS